jgi:hypothetical protein
MDEAEAIRARLRKATENARNDPTLSATGRNQRIAKAYRQAVTDMQQLADTFEATNRLPLSSLSRELFGAGSANATDAISMRDASDRAAAVKTPDEALSLLQRADRNTDRVLVQAVASYAADQAVGHPISGPAWLSVLDRFAKLQGSGADQTADKLSTLLQLRQAGNATSHLSNALHFTVPRPAEIQRMTPGELNAAETAT